MNPQLMQLLLKPQMNQGQPLMPNMNVIQAFLKAIAGGQMQMPQMPGAQGMADPYAQGQQGQMQGGNGWMGQFTPSSLPPMDFMTNLGGM